MTLLIAVYVAAGLPKMTDTHAFACVSKPEAQSRRALQLRDKTNLAASSGVLLVHVTLYEEQAAWAQTIHVPRFSAPPGCSTALARVQLKHRNATRVALGRGTTDAKAKMATVIPIRSATEDAGLMIQVCTTQAKCTFITSARTVLSLDAQPSFNGQVTSTSRTKSRSSRLPLPSTSGSTKQKFSTELVKNELKEASPTWSVTPADPAG